MLWGSDDTVDERVDQNGYIAREVITPMRDLKQGSTTNSTGPSLEYLRIRFLVSLLSGERPLAVASVQNKFRN